MKKQKKLLIVLLVCLIGSFVMPLADSSSAVRDVTSVNIYGSVGRSNLQFKLVDDVYTKKAMDWIAENHKNKKISEDIKRQKQLLLQISKDIELTQKYELLFRFVRDQETDKLYPQDIMTVERITTLGGNDLGEVWVNRDSFDTPVIDFEMSSRGAVEFKRLTGAENTGRRLAIIINNKIMSAPRIMEQIDEGTGQISGIFATDEVEDFVDILMNSSVPLIIE